MFKIYYIGHVRQCDMRNGSLEEIFQGRVKDIKKINEKSFIKKKKLLTLIY